MTPDITTLLTWLGQGAISLLFGMLGGFVGSYVQYRFQRRLEEDRERRRLRDSLTEGVRDLVQQQSLGELDEVGGHRDPTLTNIRRGVAAAVAVLAVIAGLIVNPLLGLTGLFAAGVLLGIRHA
jgi:hypothetical protein